MASPVGSSGPHHVRAVTDLYPPVPGGVGSTPTTLQSARPKEPAPEEKGYVERAVHALRDWIVWLFNIMFGCFKKEVPPEPPKLPEPAPTPAPPPKLPEPTPPPAPPPPPKAQEPPPQPEPAPAPKFETMGAAALWVSFNQIFSNDESKDFIYVQIGKTYKARNWTWSHAQLGKWMVEQNPQLLIPFLQDVVDRMQRAKS